MTTDDVVRHFFSYIHGVYLQAKEYLNEIILIHALYYDYVTSLFTKKTKP